MFAVRAHEKEGPGRLLRQSLPDPMYAAVTWCPWPRGDTSNYAPGLLVLPDPSEKSLLQERDECDELDTADVTSANDAASPAS